MIQGLEAFRPQLQWICEALIPRDPDGVLPSALDVDVIGRLLPRALKARPDFEAPLAAVLQSLPAQPPTAPLAALKGLGDTDFEQLSYLIAGAYFMDDEVNRRLFYPGQEALHVTTDYDEIMEVAERVMNRGHVYIPTPGVS